MAKILVIGAQNIDISAHTTTPYLKHDSNPVSLHFSFGGVGKNIATNLKRLENEVHFLTVFTDDMFGKSQIDHLKELGLQFDHSITVPGKKSSIYLAIMDEKNDLHLGLNDMEITSSLTRNVMEERIDYINQFDYLVLDNNLPQETLNYVLENTNGVTFIDAVSARKVHKLKSIIDKVTYVKLNEIELTALTGCKIDESIQIMKENNTKIITNKGDDIILVTKDNISYHKPIPLENIVDSSGAGDAFFSGFIHGIANNKDIMTALIFAKRSAYITLQSTSSTAENLLKNKVEEV